MLAQTPGTVVDLIARVIADRLRARWDQPVVVENRPGASGAIGMQVLAKSEPDGHAVNVNVATTLTLPLFYPTLAFDVLKSFTAITYIGSSSFALVVHSAVPVNDLNEFIAYAKARPGKLNYGSPGIGTHHHLMMEMFKFMTGVHIVHVPYKGSAGATTDLLGGQIPTMFIPTNLAIGMQKRGNVKILGSSGRERHPLFPEIQSLHEQGVTGFDVDPWYAIWGPAGLPADIVAKYTATLRDILDEPETRDALGKQGVLAKRGGPEELARIARNEYDMWAKLVKEAKISAD
jgi:tripartite-type tricarboxylate transporter receptor subunit TctC